MKKRLERGAALQHPPPHSHHRLRRWLFHPLRFWTLFVVLLVLSYIGAYFWWLSSLRKNFSKWQDPPHKWVYTIFSPAIAVDYKWRDFRSRHYLEGIWTTSPVRVSEIEKGEFPDRLYLDDLTVTFEPLPRDKTSGWTRFRCAFMGPEPVLEQSGNTYRQSRPADVIQSSSGTLELTQNLAWLRAVMIAGPMRPPGHTVNEWYLEDAETAQAGTIVGMTITPWPAGTSPEFATRSSDPGPHDFDLLRIHLQVAPLDWRNPRETPPSRGVIYLQRANANLHDQ